MALPLAASVRQPRMPAPPEALQPLHDAALAEFAAGHYQRALPLLGRLALALPPSHGLCPVVRATLARAFLALGNIAAAERELDRALGSEPANAAVLALEQMLRRAVGG